MWAAPGPTNVYMHCAPEYSRTPGQLLPGDLLLDVHHFKRRKERAEPEVWEVTGAPPAVPHHPPLRLSVQIWVWLDVLCQHLLLPKANRPPSNQVWCEKCIHIQKQARSSNSNTGESGESSSWKNTLPVNRQCVLPLNDWPPLFIPDQRRFFLPQNTSGDFTKVNLPGDCCVQGQGPLAATVTGTASPLFSLCYYPDKSLWTQL